jgi:hypothetical protein
MAAVDGGEHVADVSDTQDVIGSVSGDGVAGVRSAGDVVRCLLDRHRCGQEIDLGPRDHHFIQHSVGSGEDVGEDPPLLRGELLVATDQDAQLLLADVVGLGVRVDTQQAHHRVGRH